MVELKVKKLKETAILPVKATEGSVCYDVFVSEDVIVLPRTACERAYLVPTGLQITPPKGYGLKVHLRSSTGRNTGLRLANQTGIIDTDYQGEIFICLENFSKLPEVIKAGDRVAQLEVIAIIDSNHIIVTIAYLRSASKYNCNSSSSTSSNRYLCLAAI